MPLVVQAAGLLVAGALVFLMARQAGVPTRRAFAAVAVIPVVVAGMLIAPNLRNSIDSMRANRAAGKGISDDQARTIAGANAGLDVQFLDWTRERLGDGDTFHVVAGGSQDPGAVDQWATFQLAPNLATDRANADWLIFYDHAAPKRPARGLAAPLVYAPGFEIVRRADAS